jgi:hypothetical protein
LAQRQQRRIAATSAALPGSTKAPLHLFATHIVDRHQVMTHGTFFLQWWARTSGFLSSPHFAGSTCGQTVPYLILCTFGLVLASRAVKERKIANLTRNYGRFKLSVSNVISNAAVIESLLMKMSELPGARSVYRPTNRALAQISWPSDERSSSSARNSAAR